MSDDKITSQNPIIQFRIPKRAFTAGAARGGKVGLSVHKLAQTIFLAALLLAEEDTDQPAPIGAMSA